MAEIEDVIASCRQQLANFGWKVEDGTAIASKEFQTAVGVKKALAYFSKGDSYNCRLHGDYQSQGSNILEPHGVLIPKPSSEEEIRHLAIAFAKKADAAVDESYARRLYTKFGFIDRTCSSVKNSGENDAFRIH